MLENNKIVVLCKGSGISDKQEIYIKTLESAGYACEYLQTLQFEFVNISELRACLSTADKYGGNILILHIACVTISSIIFYYYFVILCRSNINQSTYC